MLLVLLGQDQRHHQNCYVQISDKTKTIQAEIIDNDNLVRPRSMIIPVQLDPDQ